MPRMSLRGKFFKMNPGRYSNDLIRALIIEANKALVDFTLVAYPLVRVDTGMSRGSFYVLGEHLGLSIPISPKSFGKKYNDKGRGVSGPKTPEFGKQLTRFTPPTWVGGGEVKVVFSPGILQYDIHDPEWGSLEAGAEAFENYMTTTGLSNLPKLRDYVQSVAIFTRG